MAYIDDETLAAEHKSHKPVGSLGALIGFAFFSAALAGFLVGTRADPKTPLAWMLLGILVVGTLLCGVISITRVLAYYRVIKTAQIPKREKLSNWFIGGSIALGIIMAIIMVITGNAPGHEADANAISPAIAISAAIGVAILGGGGTWYWLARVVDEHERNAYREGAEYAGHAVVLITPIWWLLWRGNLLPEPDAMIIMFTMAIVWTFVWFSKKFA